MEDKIEENKTDLHWKDNDLYYANKSKDSNLEWAQHLQKQRNEYKEQLAEKQKEIEYLMKMNNKVLKICEKLHTDYAEGCLPAEEPMEEEDADNL